MGAGQALGQAWSLGVLESACDLGFSLAAEAVGLACYGGLGIRVCGTLSGVRGQPGTGVGWGLVFMGAI